MTADDPTCDVPAGLTAEQQMHRALNALYLMVPEDVARDVAAKVYAAFDVVSTELGLARVESSRRSAVSERTPTVEDIEAVEQEVGMAAGAWDMVPPERIIAAAWKLRRSPAEAGATETDDARDEHPESRRIIDAMVERLRYLEADPAPWGSETRTLLWQVYSAAAAASSKENTDG